MTASAEVVAAAPEVAAAVLSFMVLREESHVLCEGQQKTSTVRARQKVVGAASTVDKVMTEAASTADKVMTEAPFTADEIVAEAKCKADKVVAEAVSTADEVVAEAASTADEVAAETASTEDEAVVAKAGSTVRTRLGRVAAGRPRPS